MKLTAVSLLVLVSTLCGQFVFAAPSSGDVPYYGEKFHHDLASGISNDDLKKNIQFVLRSFHLRVNGSYDQIVNGCSGDNCYQHVSLGYDGARTFLLGSFYLVDEGHGDYAVKDVYCDSIRGSADFRGGNAPAPGRIPDGNIVNTEHTWPQSKFSGRHNKSMQKADMHHLYPTDNEMNSIRGNNPFGEVVQDRKPLKCRVSRFGRAAQGGADVFMPPANHRGNVARALFYFSVRYDLPIDSRQEATLRKWSKEDPIDDEEISRNDEIHKMQGNRNPFIDFPGLEDSIGDF
ncbi:endonuclease I family protein [Bdellovibrio bacteriovorus]|uniref:Nuclease n=1 Tax=Bdellovibrio bacteriovorus TaxID=959 RepID=A0A1Z3ND19_BDEBC|nr:endonuclease [Bdellovibrio bacteriovorus]ASD65364.1 nuclease [Bdellovibrio bacteriovorus]